MDRQRALTRAYKSHHQAIYRYCLTIVGNPDDAQEALQNTMVKALRALQGERREIQLKPWLYKIAHNESIELLRKRRDASEIDVELAAPDSEVAETAARRERLRRLLADLRELPERQRAALVMRELGGLSFSEIGEAFDTSKAVARQTVYEARIGLRELETGREMSCEEVMHRLSNADGRMLRRRNVRAHLRSCADCRAFQEAIAQRQHDLAALAPLPAVASAATLHAALGGGQGAATSGGVAGAVGASAGKALVGSTALKTVATVAAVAAVGAGAADGGGLVDLGLPGNGGSAGASRTTEANAVADPASTKSPNSRRDTGGEKANGPQQADGASSTQTPETATERPEGGQETSSTGEPSVHPAPPSSGELPSSSDHGQETAASHGGGRNAGSTHASDHPGAPEAAQKHPSPPSHSPPKSADPGPPADHGPPPKEERPDISPSPPSQPAEGSPNRGGPSENHPGPKEGR